VPRQQLVRPVRAYVPGVTEPREIVVRAPAKLNLALSVGPPGADRMHPIASWMVTLDFGDDLHLRMLEPGRDSLYAVVWAKDAPRATTVDWPIQKDLAVRAHLALQQHVGRPLPVRMKLEKRVPVGGGLGGGSSNAAAMLRGLRELFGLPVGDDELCEIARGLGSDVPFLVRGGSAVVEGLGERIERLGGVPDVHAVLAFPAASCPTGPVYGKFDLMRPDASLQPARVRSMASGAAVAHDAPFNDLAEPAIAVAPVLADELAQLRAITGRPAHVSGSGSTIFALCDGRLEADLLAEQVRTRARLPAVAASAVGG
jgi:4-diphosphocytidyl-2-C-methyl-D-erythritol kinase